MKVDVSPTAKDLGIKAAQKGADILRSIAKEKERLTVVIPTGASQLSMYDQLLQEPNIPWERIDLFHLDEYVGISSDHAASFRRYLRERIIARLPAFGSFCEVRGDAEDIQQELSRLNALLGPKEIDICFGGIGENGHLAFNDPPADFDTTDPYILVNLDMGCRRQQYNEGWFKRLEDVPKQAISMSIRKIMGSRHLIIAVPDGRKAEAVRNCLESEVSPMLPASILQQHENCHIFLDPDSSRLMTKTQ
ncbi:Glucosamine-6-phosphate deaminase [hydrothermal vent metagenome]|uniref:Glucosamine-6-phosphate deaminase n=1 Tax=hydrothermal vent metagenome TaxID=652676 RepID=A0A3B0R4Q4_9ZZZZ